MRFIFADDIVGAWSTFGGISARMNRISVVLHIETTESIASAATYKSLLSPHIEDISRLRAELTIEHPYFSGLLSVGKTRFKIHAVAQSDKPIPPAKTPMGHKEPPT